MRMQCARSGSTQSRRPRALALLLIALAACSLNGEGTGGDRAPVDDEEDIDDPMASRRDAGVDAMADARTQPPKPEPDAARDAFVPPSDAALDARAPVDASADAALADAEVDAGPVDAGPACVVAGNYAALVDFNVEWIPTTLGGVLPVLKGGQGSIRMFATVRLDANGSSVVEPCGTTVPDFEGTPIVGGELYGGDIPVAAWDAPAMPSFPTRWSTVCDRPGCGYLGEETNFVIGARAVTPNAPWPLQGGWIESGQYEATDDDGDGRPGLTMITRGPPKVNPAGRPYAFPPVGLATYGRARKLSLAMQLRVKLSGALQSCDLITGSSSTAEAHVSAVGCTGVYDMTTDELDCAPEVAQFVDTNLPMWTVKGATFKMQRLPPGGGCYTARTLLTQP
ncbi:MAG: hypothetical protein ABW352_22290 [Polyangiales bacterium]